MWVDRYCINQKNIDEKNEEIVKMKYYYNNALCTIVWLHDIEDIYDDMNKSEWMERLWTLQEWELSKERWILTNNGNFIRYQYNKDNEKLLPESRVSTDITINENDVYFWLLNTNELKCLKDIDKINGILGMIAHSKYVDLSNVHSKEIYLYKLFIVSFHINSYADLLFIFDHKKIDIDVKHVKKDIIYNIKKSNSKNSDLDYIYLDGNNFYITYNGIYFRGYTIDVEQLEEKTMDHIMCHIDFPEYSVNIQNKKIYTYLYKQHNLICLYLYNFVEKNQNNKICISFIYYSKKQKIGIVLANKHNNIFEIIGFCIEFVIKPDNDLFSGLFKTDDIDVIGYINTENYYFDI